MTKHMAIYGGGGVARNERVERRRAGERGSKVSGSDSRGEGEKARHERLTPRGG